MQQLEAKAHRFSRGPSVWERGRMEEVAAIAESLENRLEMTMPRSSLPGISSEAMCTFFR